MPWSPHHWDGFQGPPMISSSPVPPWPSKAHPAWPGSLLLPVPGQLRDAAESHLLVDSFQLLVVPELTALRGQATLLTL